MKLVIEMDENHRIFAMWETNKHHRNVSPPPKGGYDRD